MTEKEILKELEDIANRVGLEVRYDVLEGKGGDCLVRGKPYVIINEGLLDEEKILILVSALKTVDLEGVFLKPKIREIITGNSAN
jgi:hypothetical protein